MLNYCHFIYTRRDSTGWGLISPAREGIDRQAVEALCRRLPADETGPVYALHYSTALAGFVLCSSAVCDSGDDHRGRIVVDAVVAADPAVRADPALAALPDHFVQTWDPAWETQEPAPQSIYEQPAPPTPEQLSQRLAQLGIRESSLPAFLQFLYRSLPQQGVAFSLPVPRETTPLQALRALAALLSWAAPPAFVRSGTVSCGPVAVKDLRFYLSPAAGRYLPALAEGSAQACFYQKATEQLRTDPAGYLGFLQRQVLDLLPGETISWQAYPGLYLLSLFAENGEQLLQQPDMCAMYVQNLDFFLACHKEYPVLEERLRALFIALAQRLDQKDKQARQRLLARLTPLGDAQTFAALPPALRAEAAAQWVSRVFSQKGENPVQLLDQCRFALDCLTEFERWAVWQNDAAPCLEGQPLEVFRRVLAGFRLTNEPRLLQARLLEEMNCLLDKNWMVHPENGEKLAGLDRFSRENGLSDCFQEKLLEQLARSLEPQDLNGTRYYCCTNLLQMLPERPAVRTLLEQYRPAPKPAERPVETEGNAAQPVPAQPIHPELVDWLAQYDSLLEHLTGLLEQAQAVDQINRLPERFLKERGLLELAQKAAQQAGLTKKQLRELLGWRAMLL